MCEGGVSHTLALGMQKVMLAKSCGHNDRTGGPDCKMS
jgi:hypothetical protein